LDARISSKVTVDKAIPDRRVMEEYLAVTSSSGVRDALLDAQSVIYDAWERTTVRSRTDSTTLA